MTLFVYFRPFLNTMTNIVQDLSIKSVDGVLGIQTRGCRMVGGDEFSELRRPPWVSYYMLNLSCPPVLRFTLRIFLLNFSSTKSGQTLKR